MISSLFQLAQGRLSLENKANLDYVILFGNPVLYPLRGRAKKKHRIVRRFGTGAEEEEEAKRGNFSSHNHGCTVTMSLARFSAR